VSRHWPYIILLGLWFVGFFAELTLGPATLPIGKVFGILSGRDEGASWGERLIVREVRLPRALLGTLVGGALATAGGVMQGLFRNPLVSPYTLGLAGGASLGAAVVIGLGVSSAVWLPLAAFAGGVAAITLVMSLARKGSLLKLILAGIALSALFSALTSTVIYLSSPEETSHILAWLLGGLGRATWQGVYTVAPAVALEFTGSLFLARELDLLALGEEQASHMGLDRLRTRWLAIGLSTLTTAVSVAYVGPIGFVGLIVPHGVRLALGPQHRKLFLACFIAGAAFLLWADLIARVILRPVELPTGVVTAFLGVPFFLYLLHRSESRWSS